MDKKTRVKFFLNQAKANKSIGIKLYIHETIFIDKIHFLLAFAWNVLFPIWNSSS